MHQDSPDVSAKRMGAEGRPEERKMETDRPGEKLEGLIICMMHYLLEKVRTAQNEPEPGIHDEGISDRSKPENPQKTTPNGSLPKHDLTRYPAKAIEKRFRD